MQLLKLFPFIFSFLVVSHLAATSSSSSSPKVRSRLRSVSHNSVLHGSPTLWAPIYLGLGDAYRERAENLTGHAQEDETEKAEREAVKSKIQRQAVMCYLCALNFDNTNTRWQAKSRLLDCCLNGAGVKRNFPKASELAAELSQQNEDPYLNWFGTLRTGQMLMLGQGCSLTPASFEKGCDLLQDLESDLVHKAANGFTRRRTWAASMLEEKDINSIHEQSSEIELLIKAFLANISCLLDDKHPYAIGVYNRPKSDDLIALEQCKKIHANMSALVEESDEEGSDEYLAEFSELCMQGNDLLRMKMSSTSSWLCKAVLFQAFNKGYKLANSALPNDPQQSTENLLAINYYRNDGWRRLMRNALAEQNLVPLASYPGLSSYQKEYFSTDSLPPAQRTIAHTTNVIFGTQVPPFVRRRLAIEWLEQFLMNRNFLRFDVSEQRSLHYLNGIIQTIQHDDLSETSGMMGHYSKVYAKILLSAALFDNHMGLICSNHRQLAVDILNSLLASQTFSEIEMEEGEYHGSSFYDEDESIENICENIKKYVPALQDSEALQKAETLIDLITIMRDYFQASIDNPGAHEG